MHQPQVLRSALQAWEEVANRAGTASPASGSTADLRQTIGLGDYVCTIERAAADARAPSLGWQIGSSVALPHLGDIGAAVTACSTLGSALKRICEYFALLQDLTELRLVREGDHVALTYRILDPDIWPRHQDAIFTLAIKARILFDADGFNKDEVEIYLETPEHDLAADLSRTSGLRCHAGAETNMIRFPAAALDLPLRPASPPDAARLGELARQLRDKRRARLVEEKVRGAIYLRLGRGPITQDVVACELGLSGRTLRRQLAARDTSFQQIVDECRIRQAVLEVRRRRDMSITEIALRLGYSEHSTFSRAFARCTGMPPQAFLRRPAMERGTAMA